MLALFVSSIFVNDIMYEKYAWLTFCVMALLRSRYIVSFNEGAAYRNGITGQPLSRTRLNEHSRQLRSNADADVEQLNVAEQVADGMKVTVPHKGQILASSTTNFEAASGRTVTEGTTMRRARHAQGGTGRHKLQPGQTLNVNTATEQELTTLPGVGRGLARRIVEYRVANGPFQTVDDLQNVSGVGPSKFEKMAPYIHLYFYNYFSGLRGSHLRVPENNTP